jgi:hypothetical protein
VIEVSAVAVVDGATVVMDPPASPARVGTEARRSASWFQPRPSITSSTTRSASWATDGSHSGPTSRGCSSAGTTLVMQPPW